MSIRVGINGFGRIGRGLTRVLMNHENVELVAVNDLAELDTLFHLLKYDSIHRAFPSELEKGKESILINGNAVKFFRESNPELIDWDKHNVDVVIEATGRFKSKNELQAHFRPGVKKVIVSAPADEEIPMVVLGVNEHIISESDSIVSNASCTTNCAAPMIKIVNDLCDVESAYITTVHSYTTDQGLHDAPHKDLRRARAAALSIVPTTTGAAKAMTRIFPEIQDKIGGCGIRVPVPDGSLTDITFTVNKKTSVDEVNRAFKEASEKAFKGIVSYTSDPIVSSDIIGMPYSVLFDDQLTSVIGNMVKVVGWYDNEIGYSNRIADLINKICA
ncbi:MAG: type I glyceraldehyde-3-phosphate dehydrogenase [Schleiferiaceae bacterium]|jgi:glyceraldehyde 3-phosphate dehydrogenase|nr:type I glyceraldehyde-3-phosphate dehydrogenase [Schleiferiaceae bacterium]